MRREPTIAIDGAFAREPRTGSGQYTLGLWRQLATGTLGCRAVLLSPRGPVVEHVGTGRTVEGQRLGKGEKLWWEQVGVTRRARAVGADLLHVPYFAGPLRCSLPLVVTVHDVIPWALPAYRQALAMRLYLRVVGQAARRADAVITDSEYSKHDIVRWLRIPPERISVVPLAADERFRPAESEEPLRALRRRFDLRGAVVFNVGGLDVRKNLPVLLEAFARALPRLPEGTTLVIAGQPHTDNPRLYPPLEPIVRRLRLEQRVVLTGPISEEDKLAFYQLADLYVYPSLYEGFGLSPLEAMACGTPVVAAARTSLPEVVGEGGLLVEPEPDVLAEAIERVLLDAELRAALSRRALAQAARFSWERTARETVAVYHRVLQHRAARLGVANR